MCKKQYRRSTEDEEHREIIGDKKEECLQQHGAVSKNL